MKSPTRSGFFDWSIQNASRRLRKRGTTKRVTDFCVNKKPERSRIRSDVVRILITDLKNKASICKSVTDTRSGAGTDNGLDKTIFYWSRTDRI